MATEELTPENFKIKVIEYFNERDEPRAQYLLDEVKKKIKENLSLGKNVTKLVDREVELEIRLKNFHNGVTAPVSIPGLALHLNWSVENVLAYPIDGPHAAVLEYAKTKCEAYLVDAIFTKRIDKSIGTMMLQKYFGGDLKNGRAPAGSRKGIAGIIKSIQDKNEQHDRETRGAGVGK